MLAKYKETRKQIEEKEAELDRRKHELDEMKASAEQEQEKFSGPVTEPGKISAYSSRRQRGSCVEALVAQIEEAE